MVPIVKPRYESELYAPQFAAVGIVFQEAPPDNESKFEIGLIHPDGYRERCCWTLPTPVHGCTTWALMR